MDATHMSKAKKPDTTISAAERAQHEHDTVVREIDELRAYVDYATIKERTKRASTRNLILALAEAFSDKRYPKGYKAIQVALAPIYKRKGWGEVPKRDAIDRALGRRKFLRN
jgi:hypothetical protein